MAMKSCAIAQDTVRTALIDDSCERTFGMDDFSRSHGAFRRTCDSGPCYRE
jgi:hypothetical protein